ncbi:hypothetical protein B0H12DRAFT_544891 [Mycena haematopus]|nr:hypothetical protein B0H12DRAFT_544891 [Mycena haematopus]
MQARSGMRRELKVFCCILCTSTQPPPQVPNGHRSWMLLTAGMDRCGTRCSHSLPVCGKPDCKTITSRNHPSSQPHDTPKMEEGQLRREKREKKRKTTANKHALDKD